MKTFPKRQQHLTLVRLETRTHVLVTLAGIGDHNTHSQIHDDNFGISSYLSPSTPGNIDALI